MTGQEIRNWRERPTLYYEYIPFAKRARTKIFRAIDPLQLSIHVVQTRHDGTQKSTGKYTFCWPCPSATFVSQHGDFVPRERKAANGLLPGHLIRDC